jgi:eukaryotic-like serine/threonine-protein kinase
MLGQKLGGRYQIIKQLGQGGFGTTFIAEDTQRPNNPECVVKQLKPVTTDPYTLHEAKRLFDQEAKILESLGIHHQIPRLLAHFEENQQFYLVQEYIEGHDLSQEISSGQHLSDIEVIKLLQDILEVLAFVHQQKVIHRDMKPSNIRRRKDGKIVLIDFGAVKEVKTLQVNQHGQTSFTVAIGSPGYMPSEQANGEPKLSSDIYAVGIIAIQALTGINPASRTNQGVGGLPKNPQTGEIIWRDRLHQKINPKLANIIDKMVRYHFSQRYQSADEALAAIQSLSPKSPPPKALMGVGITAIASLIVVFYQVLIPKEQFLLYENPSLGVKIKYPQSWSRQNQNAFGEVARFFPKSETPANNCPVEIIINVNSLQQQKSLDEYKDTVKQKIAENNPNSQVTDNSTADTTLSSLRGYKLVYQRQDGQCNLQVMEIGTLRNNRAYYITYAAEAGVYDKFLPKVEEMVTSFDINLVN